MIDQPVPELNAQAQTRVGLMVDNHFWYVKHLFSESGIALRRAKNRVDRVITFAVLLFAVVCFVFAGLFFFIAFNDGVTVSVVRPHASFAFFGIALLALQFLFYRFTLTSTKSSVLGTVSKDALPQIQTVELLDEVPHARDVLRLLQEDAVVALEEAYLIAKRANHLQVLPAHIFAGCLANRRLGLVFSRLGIQFDQIKDPLRRYFSRLEKGDVQFDGLGEEVIAKATERAILQHRTIVSVLDLFAAAYEKEVFLQELLYSVGVEKEEVAGVLEWLAIDDQLRQRYTDFRKSAAFKPKKNMNRAYTAVATPFLDRISVDLTRYAASGGLPMLIHREREMNDMLRSIEGGRQSIVLVGPSGVGKEAIVFGLAEKMAAEDVPVILQDKRLLRLDIPLIVSSRGGVGAEERLLAALQEVGASRNIILVIEDIDQLIGAGNGGVDLASVLAGELDKGYTFVISTVTPEAYSRVVEHSILAQKLQKIVIAEPERPAAMPVLQSKIGGIENANKILFTYKSLMALLELSDRYIHEKYLPEKAIVLAEEVGLEVGRRSSAEWTVVTKEDVASIISQKSNVPVTEVTQSEGDKLLRLEEILHERVIGQEEAVSAIASALRRARTELRAENRPMANFLFLGPTGVGKTELAKTTAEAYFGSEEAMLRFDMSEYQEARSVSRLIGDQGNSGLLTEAVRKNPFSLVLLDELEKAHPDILNLFLQVMDDGRLTDGTGRTIDFTNVILIATSNAGTAYIQQAVNDGLSMDQIKTALLEEHLQQYYRPEFLNRFDGVMVFRPLTQDAVAEIAHLMMKKLAARLLEKGIQLRATDEAIYELAQKGYDPKFGARPLRRVLQEQVDNVIAELLLKGQVGRRDTIVLDAGGAVRVEKAVEL